LQYTWGIHLVGVGGGDDDDGDGVGGGGKHAQKQTLLWRESYYFQESPAARTLVFYLFAFVCKTSAYIYIAEERTSRRL